MNTLAYIRKVTSYSLMAMIVVIISSNIASGQTNTVKTNLVNLAISGGSIQYERVIGESSTAQLGLFYSALSVDATKFSGFGIIPQYRFYPGGNEVPHGFFIAPLVGYQVFSLETSSGTIENAKADYSLLGAGFDIGNQWLFNRAFSIELSAGVSFNSTSLSIETSGANENDFSIGNFGSTTPRFGLSLGYAF